MQHLLVSPQTLKNGRDDAGDTEPAIVDYVTEASTDATKLNENAENRSETSSRARLHQTTDSSSQAKKRKKNKTDAINAMGGVLHELQTEQNKMFKELFKSITKMENAAMERNERFMLSIAQMMTGRMPSRRSPGPSSPGSPRSSSQ